MAKEKTTVKAIIPLDEFRRIYVLLPESAACQERWCAYSRTTCHVREAREALRGWWKRTNGTAPGFANYERVLQNAIDLVFLDERDASVRGALRASRCRTSTRLQGRAPR